MPGRLVMFTWNSAGFFPNAGTVPAFCFFRGK